MERRRLIRRVVALAILVAVADQTSSGRYHFEILYFAPVALAADADELAEDTDTLAARDPLSKQPELKCCAVRLRPISPFSEVRP